MVILGLLSWWYTTGWRGRLTGLRDKLASTIDYFSIDLLLRTFFSPFRQISAERVDGGLNIQMRAFLDRLISRIIGSMIRLVMMIVGVLAIIFHLVVGIAFVTFWGIIPILPIAGIVLAMTGWVPWNL